MHEESNSPEGGEAAAAAAAEDSRCMAIYPDMVKLQDEYDLLGKADVKPLADANLGRLSSDRSQFGLCNCADAEVSLQCILK